MRTGEETVGPRASLLRYRSVRMQRRLPLREAALQFFYHLRLLNWWLFLLMFLGFLGMCGMCWLQLHLGTAQGPGQAVELSRFVLESGAGLCAGMLASSLIVGDPLLEITMATPAGVYEVVIWRAGLAFCLLLSGSMTYLVWSSGNGISYASQQSPLFLLFVWLSPVLVMGMLGLFSALAVRNAALGLVITALPLAGALFLHEYLLSVQAAHLFFIPYTLWAADASDWWTNRLALLGIALILACGNWWLLSREERLLNN